MRQVSGTKHSARFASRICFRPCPIRAHCAAALPHPAVTGDVRSARHAHGTRRGATRLSRRPEGYGLWSLSRLYYPAAFGILERTLGSGLFGGLPPQRPIAYSAQPGGLSRRPFPERLEPTARPACLCNTPVARQPSALARSHVPARPLSSFAAHPSRHPSRHSSHHPSHHPRRHPSHYPLKARATRGRRSVGPAASNASMT